MRCLYILVAVSVFYECRGAEPEGRLNLSPQIAVLKDSSALLTIDDVRSADYTGAFAINGSDGFNYGPSSAAYWLRIELPAAGNKAGSILAILRARLYNVDFYTFDKKGQAIQTDFYRRGALDGGHMRYRFPAFSLQDPADVKTAYIRIQSKVLTFSVELFDRDSFTRYTWFEYLFFGIIFGILAAMVLYNLSIYLFFRDPSYILYVFYITAMLAYVSLLSGWPSAFGVTVEFLNWAVLKVWGLAVVLFLLLCRSFLMTKKEAPLSDRILVGFLILVGLTLVMQLAGLDKIPSITAYFVGLVIPPVAIVITVKRWRNGFLPARNFLAAWTILSISVYIYALLGMGIIPFSFLADMALGIGAAGESIFLSFALGDRIRILQRERRQLQERQEELTEMATRDGLTGLFNRRWFDSKLTGELEHASRMQVPLSLIMIDVDGFKDYNDSYGHSEGDKVLVLLASVMTDVLRKIDIACRYGGEEFAVIVPGVDHNAGFLIAERLRKRFANESQMPKNKLRRRTTISVGIADINDIEKAGSLLDAADNALYASKQNGRNRSTVYSKVDSKAG